VAIGFKLIIRQYSNTHEKIGFWFGLVWFGLVLFWFGLVWFGLSLPFSHLVASSPRGPSSPHPGVSHAAGLSAAPR
jgi:hypothetical protein